MGRSQVERNRVKGRPGSKGGRGGRGDGRDGGGGRQKRSGPNSRTLGDNSFRFERRSRQKNVDDDDDMMLSDDLNSLFIGSDYVGAAHYDLQEKEEEGEDTINSSLFQQTLLSLSDDIIDNYWMSIDIQSLSACFKKLPIHERLDVPYHVGKILECRYGGMVVGQSRKKTLAELREESKCIVSGDGATGSMKNSTHGDVQKEDEKSITDISNICVKEKDSASGNSGDEDDLDAWLDDMIS